MDDSADGWAFTLCRLRGPAASWTEARMMVMREGRACDRPGTPRTCLSVVTQLPT